MTVFTGFIYFMRLTRLVNKTPLLVNLLHLQFECVMICFGVVVFFRHTFRLTFLMQLSCDDTSWSFSICCRGKEKSIKPPAQFKITCIIQNKQKDRTWVLILILRTSIQVAFFQAVCSNSCGVGAETWWAESIKRPLSDETGVHRLTPAPPHRPAHAD